jgi:hypothetical protein
MVTPSMPSSFAMSGFMCISAVTEMSSIREHFSQTEKCAKFKSFLFFIMSQRISYFIGSDEILCLVQGAGESMCEPYMDIR